MGKIRLYVIIALCWAGIAQAAAENYPIRGRVIDRIARTPVAYASVVIVGQGDKGASADAEGNFVIENVKPGIYRLEASMLGYTSAVTPEYIVSAATLPRRLFAVRDSSQSVNCGRELFHAPPKIVYRRDSLRRVDCCRGLSAA